MHLDRVQLENFGIYHQHVLDFGQSDLILLYGPNESGKTTSLNGLRQALFGFRQRSPYLTAGKTMQAEVSARLAGGKQFRFTRRKGRQDDVEGLLDGKSIDGLSIAGLLGNLDINSYEQLFGFSLDELRIGEEALKSAQLSEALAGGGLAGINALQRLRSDLSNTLGELYKSRGSRSTINQKLTEIQATRAELTKVQVLPAEVEDLQRELQTLLQNSQTLREEQATTYQNRADIERLVEMMPNFRRLLQLKQQLAAIQLPEGVDMRFISNWSEHSDSRKELILMLEQELRQVQQEQLACDSLGGTSSLSEHEEAIEHLGHQVDEIVLLRKRAIDLQETYEDSVALCRRSCELLQLPGVTDDLRQFVVTPPERRELEGMCREFTNLSEQHIACSAQLTAAERSLAALQTQDDDDQPPSNLDDLAHRVKELDYAEQRMQQVTDALTQLQQNSALQNIEQQLSACAPAGLQVDLELPTTEIVQQAHESRLSVLSRQQQLLKEVAAAENEIAVVEGQLTTVNQGEVQRILDQMQLNRQQRESLYEQWEDELSQPLIAASITAEVQSQRLAELRILSEQADQLQQSLMELAESVAAYQIGQKQLDRMRSHLANLQDEHQQVSSQLAQWQLDWQQFWNQFGLVAQAPEKMQAWLVEYQRWNEHQQRISQTRRDLQIARSLVRQSRVGLLDQWPVGLREDTALVVLSSRIAAWQNAARDVARDAQRLRNAKVQVDTLTIDDQRLKEQRASIVARYQKWLSGVPIQLSWPLEQVAQLMDTIEHLRREDETARKAEAELEHVHQRIASFETASRELSRKLQLELPEPVAAELVVRDWFNEIKQLRAQRMERIRLKATIEHRQRRIAELSQEKALLDERLASLVAASGSVDAVGVGSLADQVQRAEQLRQEIAECQAVLEGQSVGQSLPELLQQLENENEVKLRMAIEQFNRNLDSLEQDRKLTDQKIGALERQIEQLAQSQLAGQLSQTLQYQRSELAELCEQWVVHRLAAELLDRAVERFASEHEPVLLQLTREFLKQLTGGRYETVEHDSANPTRFIVRNASGEAFEPEKLSTGTREQLFLAIRMAFITHYCQKHEPLPVIMDDCFVNFDDQRAAHALRAIATWNIPAQRILLSCHYRIVQSLAEVSPDIPCIHLQRDERTTVGELAGQIPAAMR